jgi:hypothetical protein
MTPLKLISLAEEEAKRHAQLVNAGGVSAALDHLGESLIALAHQFGTEADQRAHDRCVGFTFDWTYHGADPVRVEPFWAYADLRDLLKGGDV